MWLFLKTSAKVFKIVVLSTFVEVLFLSVHQLMPNAFKYDMKCHVISIFSPELLNKLQPHGHRN